MFKRPFEQKSRAPVRSSDLRKLRDEVVHAFGIDAAQARALWPDGTLSCKGTTHLDEPVTLYHAPNGDPRWFRLGKGNQGQLCPTCYVFDMEPSLLPALVTAQAVVEHLISGAALFLKGVSEHSLEALPDSAAQGDLVAIKAGSSSNPVVAVGSLAASKKELLADKQGKAVITLHARGDFLWASGSGEQAAETETRQQQPDTLSDKLASATLDEPVQADVQEQQQQQLSPSDVDRILRDALLLAISETLSKNPSMFPMPASSLYSTHILPNRRAGTPTTADIKRSSSGKLAKMIKTLTKEGLLATKEVKGELMVMSVNGTHDDVQTLRPFKTISSTSNSSATHTANGPASTSHGSHSSSTAAAAAAADPNSADMVVKEWYKPNSSTLSVFQAVPHDRPRHDLYSSHDLKKLVGEYVVAHELVHPRDQKYVTPDDLLRTVLVKKDEADVDVLSKDDLNKRFKAACQACWSVQRPSLADDDDDAVAVKKGSPPVIKVTIKNVGKRQVTLISNHEAWSDMGLALGNDELAAELKKRSASSTSVQPLAGSAKKNQQLKVEIMCQGTHDALVSKLLKERGVPGKYIDVDLTKSRK